MTMTHRWTNARSLTAAMSAMLGAAVGPVSAQDAPRESSNTLEEVMVRAQRIDESIQDVPISVTAISADVLAERGVRQTSDLVGIVPSLQINGTFSTVPKITIRGVGTNDFQQNVAAAVGTYVDEVYIGPATAQNLALFDLKGIEVLRGPQGTLYGKNSSGGAINYYTADPKRELSGGMQLALGDYDLSEFDGHVDMPVGDAGGLRLSVTQRDREGYWKNILRTGENVVGRTDGNFMDMWAGRAKLDYDFSDTVRFSGTLSTGVSRSDIPHRVPRGSFPGGGDALGYVDPPGIDEGGTDRASIDEVKMTAASAKLSTKVGAFDVTSISGWGDIERAADQDADFSPNDMIVNFYSSDQTYYSQELQAAREWSSWRWIGGVHYYKEDHEITNDGAYFRCVSAGTCTPRIAIPTILMQLAYHQENVSYAGFTQASWSATDQLTLSAGLRYTQEERTYDGSSTPLSTPIVFPGYPRYIASRTWDDLSWKLSADYSLTDAVLLYATVGTGFRAGNWNGGAFQNFAQIENPVNPETLTAYEVGVKSDLMSGTLRLNADVFFSDYQDLQVSVFRNSATVYDNAAGAEIRGAEVEAQWLATNRWTFNVALSWLDARYLAYVTGTGLDLSGNTLVNAPDFSGAVSVQYSRDVDSQFNVTGAIDVRYQSETFYRPENDMGQGGYGIVNLRGKVRLPDSDWSVGVFVNNVLDRRVIIDAGKIGPPFFIDNRLYNAPRIWGVRLAAEF